MALAISQLLQPLACRLRRRYWDDAAFKIKRNWREPKSRAFGMLKTDYVHCFPGHEVAIRDHALAHISAREYSHSAPNLVLLILSSCPYIPKQALQWSLISHSNSDRCCNFFYSYALFVENGTLQMEYDYAVHAVQFRTNYTISFTRIALGTFVSVCCFLSVEGISTVVTIDRLAATDIIKQ